MNSSKSTRNYGFSGIYQYFQAMMRFFPFYLLTYIFKFKYLLYLSLIIYNKYNYLNSCIELLVLLLL